jgi:hypothetical protein
VEKKVRDKNEREKKKKKEGERGDISFHIVILKQIWIVGF